MNALGQCASYGQRLLPPISSCPACLSRFGLRDSLPVIGWFLCAGKCRTCQAKISKIDPAAELLVGLFFLICVLQFGPTAEALKWALFSAFAVALAKTNLESGLLPNALSYPAIALGIALSFLVSPPDGVASWLASHILRPTLPSYLSSFLSALLGLTVGAGTLWLVGYLYSVLKEREGIGQGNVKLMAFVGSFLGAKRALWTFGGGFVLASLIGLFVIVVRKKSSDTDIPFGSVLGMTALLLVFRGGLSRLFFELLTFTVVWKVILEILLGIILLVIGSSVWAIIKSPRDFRRTLRDPNRLSNFFESYDQTKFLEEAEKIKPISGSYIQNIALFGRAHFGALSQTRNLLLLLAIAVIGGSYFLGLIYLVINLALFLLPAGFDIPASAKNYNLTHVYTVAVNLAKWNIEDRTNCADYCTHAEPILAQVYRLIDEMQHARR